MGEAAGEAADGLHLLGVLEVFVAATELVLGEDARQRGAALLGEGLQLAQVALAVASRRVAPGVCRRSYQVLRAPMLQG